MKERYGLATVELHYLNIKPRIICEKYLCDDKGKMPLDYKIYCSNGLSIESNGCPFSLLLNIKFNVSTCSLVMS